MKIVVLVIPTLIVCGIAPAIWAYRREVWRPLLREESIAWTTHCRATRGTSCDEFVQCCKEFPDMAKCNAIGGLFEYPVCQYWFGRQFDAQHHGNCSCFQKYIQADYKSQCQSEDEQKDCHQFATCCRIADNGTCERYVAAELEYPACDQLEGKPFNFNESDCQCAFDSPNTTELRSWTKKAPPKVIPIIPTLAPLPTPASGGNKNGDMWNWGKQMGSGLIEKMIALAATILVIVQALPGPIIE